MSSIWDSKNKFAIIIGIEDYRPAKSTLPKVAYARKDAEDFKKLLLQHFHFEEKEIALWLDEHASKIAFENDLAYQIKSLSPDTSFVFYYAGHGFSKNGQNLLTCWDTFAGNVEETSVSLRERLLDPLIKVGCQRSLVFLDACAKDVAIGRTVLTGIEAEELRVFTAAHPFHAQFMACSAGEASYPSTQLGNGIWTWHLLRALSGGVPSIISPDRTITDHALRDYLAEAVPNYITHKTTITGTQTPWANINTSKTFAVQSIPAPAAPSGQLIASIKINYDGAFLRTVDCVAVSDFEGFDPKKHKVPGWYSSSTKDFVQKVAAGEVAAEIKEIYDNLKTELGLKFNEISKSSDGNITVKIFRYTLNVEHDDKDHTNAYVTRILNLRCKPEELPEEIDEIFPYCFEEVVLPFEGRADFGKLVTAFEHLAEDFDGDLEEDEDTQFISYMLSDKSKVIVKCNDKEIIVRPSGARTIRDLLNNAQKVLVDLQGQQKCLGNTPSKLPSQEDQGSIALGDKSQKAP